MFFVREYRQTPEFQFHSGSIKSEPRPQAPAAIAGFNSIVVRLKAGRVGNGKTPFCGFNSIVVRLKGGAKRARGGAAGRFQFHSGSIKRICIDPTVFLCGKVSIP